MRCSDVPSHAPVVLIANKQDLPNAKKEADVEKRIGLNELCGAHPTLTIPCCAVTGEGLDDSLDLLYDLIQKSRKLDKGKKKISR